MLSSFLLLPHSLPLLLLTNSAFPYFLLYFLSHTLDRLFCVSSLSVLFCILLLFLPALIHRVRFLEEKDLSCQQEESPEANLSELSLPGQNFVPSSSLCFRDQRPFTKDRPLCESIRNAISALLSLPWVMPAASSALENTDLSYQQSWANPKTDHSLLSWLVAPWGHRWNNVVASVPNKVQFQYDRKEWKICSPETLFSFLPLE